MTDITERLRELSKARWDRDAWERETTVRIPAEPDRDIDLVLASAAEQIDRLRARVAKLESARGEPVAWMNPYGGTLQVRITGLEYEKYTIPLYTAPPAQAVDVDAISDEAIEQGCEAMWAHSYRIADPGSMRAALRAIFNKGE